MPKTTHLGEKLKQEMARLGLKNAQIAELFGVKTPSVYDWIQFGRIHKKHFPQLVKVFGRPLSWWLNSPPEDELEAGGHAATNDPSSPRHRVLIDLYESLPKKEQDDLIRSLEEKKQHYDAVIEELTARKRQG